MRKYGVVKIWLNNSDLENRSYIIFFYFEFIWQFEWFNIWIFQTVWSKNVFLCFNILCLLGAFL